MAMQHIPDCKEDRRRNKAKKRNISSKNKQKKQNKRESAPGTDVAIKGTTYLTVEETEPQSKRKSRAKNGQKSEIKHVQIALLARRDTCT